MKRILVALSLSLGLTPALAQQAVVIPATMAQVSVAAGTQAATKLISGISGKSIYVTQVNLIPVATAAVTFTTGTGTNCGTGTASVTGVMTFAAGQVLNLGDGYGAVFVIPQGNDLCLTISTANAPGSIAYAQF